MKCQSLFSVKKIRKIFICHLQNFLSSMLSDNTCLKGIFMHILNKLMQISLHICRVPSLPLLSICKSTLAHDLVNRQKGPHQNVQMHNLI